jgi:hypothetical protein
MLTFLLSASSIRRSVSRSTTRIGPWHEGHSQRVGSPAGATGVSAGIWARRRRQRGSNWPRRRKCAPGSKRKCFRLGCPVSRRELFPGPARVNRRSNNYGTVEHAPPYARQVSVFSRFYKPYQSQTRDGEEVCASREHRYPSRTGRWHGQPDFKPGESRSWAIS